MRHLLPFRLLLVVVALCASACSLRRQGRTATTGAIEAFGPPGEEEEFKQEVRDFAHQLILKASQDPPNPRDVAQDTARGFVQGTALALSEPKLGARLSGMLGGELPQLLRSTSSGAFEAGALGMVDGLSAREEDLASLAALIASRAAEAATAAALRRLDLELGAGALGGSGGPTAFERALERVAAATVRGALGEMGAGLDACEDPSDPRCPRQAVSRLSRSAASGALQGVVGTALLVLAAFAVGALATLAATRLASRRRAGHA